MSTAWFLELGLVAVALAAAGVFLARRAGRPGIWVAAAITLVSVGATTAWGLASARRWASVRELVAAVPDPADPEEGFVTSKMCRDCHPYQYATWYRSYHRTMTQPATPETVIGDFDDVRMSSGGRRYHLQRRGDEFIVTTVDPEWEQEWVEKQIDPDSVPDPPIVEKRIVMTTGSHHMQTYWTASDKDGKLFNFPFTWLNDSQRWTTRESVFIHPPEGTRFYATWHDVCIQCHSVAGEMNYDAASGEFDPQVAELGITCEACHGPAEEHVRANRNPLRRYWQHLTDEPDPTIVHPERLSAARSTHLCAQCHSMLLYKADVHAQGRRYRAGDDLKEIAMVLHTSDARMPEAELDDWPRMARHLKRQKETFLQERFWSDGMARVSGRENNGMSESACFRGGELSCLSCHSMHSSDPDEQLARGMDGDGACLQCHPTFASALEEHTHHPIGSSGSACLNCHMPYTTYGLMQALRHHLIDSPTVASSIETGRGNACNLCHMDRSLGWAAQRLREWYGQPKPELTEDQQSTSAAVLWILAGDAGQRALLAWHMGWEPAVQASGADWIGLYLGHLLADPYSAVRYIAHRSLRQRQGFQNFDYDFIANTEELADASRRAVAQWRGARSEASRTGGPEVLVGSDGSVDWDAFRRLAGQRDDRDMWLRE